MSFFKTNFATSAPVFIPNLLKPSAPPGNSRTTIHPACPTRHPQPQYALIPSPLSSRLAPLAALSRNATPNISTSPTIVSVSPSPTLHPLPLIDVTTTRPDPSLRPTNPPNLPPSFPQTQPPQRRGHRHTPESRRKIGIANRGNTPWNKGRRHSEETKRKIAENTKRAMLKPEMRQILQQRAKGRKHSEATKLKIRETARLTRGNPNPTKRRKKTPVPYAFSPHVIKDLNDCITKQIEHAFEQDTNQDAPRYIIREKRVVSEETRQKLSRRIKEMWNDPEYRSRVASGVEERYRRIAEHKNHTSDAEASSTEKAESYSLTKRRPRQKTKKEADRAEQAKPDVTKRTERLSTNYADIVLDSDTLDGWTKEDLGIVGAHGAGRIDEAIMTSNISTVSPLSEVQRDSHGPEPDPAFGLEPTINTETLHLNHEELAFETSNSKSSSTLQAAIADVQQNLDFSRLDLATDYSLSQSHRNDADFLDQQVASFNHEPLLEAELPGGPFDQLATTGDFMSESVMEEGSHDPFQYTGDDSSQDPNNRSSFNFLEEDPSMFGRY